MRGRYHEPQAMRKTLPGRVYTDEDWLALEMERIFGAMWLAAGRVEELAGSGAFVSRSIAGADLLLVRGQDGTIRGFHNVCRHRGTRLCDAPAGQFNGSIQCPYHAWTYGLDGHLLAAPQMDEVVGFEPGAHGLGEVACAEWDGHLFFNLQASPVPLADQLGDLPARFAPWHMGDLRRVRRIVYDVRANWKLIVQNYNECLHCPVIHPLLNRMHHYLGAENVPSTGSYCGGAMAFREGVETLSSDGKRRRAVLPGLGERERALVNYFAIYPNLLLTLHPDYMVTVTIWPLARNRTTAGVGVALPSSRDRQAGLCERRRDRLLGPDQPRGLGDLRTGAARDRVARVPPGALFEPRNAVVGIRSLHSVAHRTRARRKEGRGRKEDVTRRRDGFR